MRRLPILLFPLALASPLAGAADARPAPTAEQTRLEVRRAVEAHRARERDDIQRQEAEAGRRLTPAERAELREQVRYQWLLPSTASAVPGTAGEGSPGNADSTGPSPVPGSLRH